MERHVHQLRYIVKHGGAEFAEAMLNIINDFYVTVKQRQGVRGRWSKVVLMPVARKRPPGDSVRTPAEGGTGDR